jgi:Thioesterase-like superfamily
MTSAMDGYPGYHNVATEHRFARGSWEQLGPVFDWIRLRVPLLPNVELTPLQRVAGAADFANGISRVLSFDEHLFINPDLTIHLARPAVGDWIGVDAVTHHGPRGIGLSDSALYDPTGRIGRSNQSLLLDVR